jgi:hypothetical protein
VIELIKKVRQDTVDLSRLIPGWLLDEDIYTFFAVDDYLHEQNVKGDILEIGVYKGKSAIILNSLIRESEKLYLCDIFDGETTEKNKREILNSYDKYNINQLNSLFHKHFDQYPEILNCNSTSLSSVVGDKKFRLIHVDGSHEFSIVQEDVRNVYNWALMPNGIVIFDDYRSAHTIGVSAAIWEAILFKKMKPILRTESKLYCVLSTERHFQMEVMSKHLISMGLKVKEEEFLDFKIKVISPMKQPYEYYPIIQQLTPPKIYGFLSRINIIGHVINFFKSRFRRS